MLALATDEPVNALRALRRALDLWTRIQAPYELARTRVLLARACQALGDGDGARSLLQSARESFVALGAKPAEREVADLLGPPQPPDGLTAREVEVLELVASGLSNPQIAEGMILSEKTVARHLSNIFTKIGVHSRTAAAAYAYEHRLR